MSARTRLGILASHPIQYQVPIFRELARHVDLHVFFAHRQTRGGQAKAGFGVEFDWDLDLLDGYAHTFLPNVARHPDTSRFRGCDTPAIQDAINRNGFDTFLVMGWNLKCYWQAVRACHISRIPVMVRGDSQLWTRRNPLTRGIKRLVYPYLLQQFDAFLYVGHRSRMYLEHYGVSERRLFFSPHCVDVDRFAGGSAAADRQQLQLELGIPHGHQVVMFSGRLVPMKHPADLISALALLQNGGARIHALVVGDGLLRQALTDMARHLGVSSTFAGFWNQSRLPSTYAVTDALVLPSDARETWGLVVNEALACGVPAVVSDEVGCAPDLVRSGVTGELFRARDVHSLAGAIAKVLARPRDAAAIKRIADDYSPEVAARGILAAMHAQYPKRTH
jgi:glycosyltransferase involved in cell wall biosynthesis